jgi:hypothetical protein
MEKSVSNWRLGCLLCWDKYSKFDAVADLIQLENPDIFALYEAGIVSTMLFSDDGTNRAEIFLPGIACAAIRAFGIVNAVKTIAFNNSFLRTYSIPDAGKALNAFLANPVFHNGTLSSLNQGKSPSVILCRSFSA